MRSSSLSRRALVGSVLSLSLVGAGLAAFAADATAGCSFTDPAGDSAVDGIPMSGDDDLDITAAGLTTADDALTAAVKVVGLTEYGPENYPGDDFEYAFTLNKKAFLLGAYRDLDPTTGDTIVSPYVYVDDTEAAAPSLKPVHDVKTSTFSISIGFADLEKLAGTPASGAALSALSVTAYANFGGPERVADKATPKDAATTYVVGSSSCGGAAAPAPTGSASAQPSASASASTSASPSATASSTATPGASGSATPAPSGSPSTGGGDAPTSGCFAFTDPKGDSTAAIGPASTGNDPDLDLLGVTFRTTTDVLSAYLKVDKLAAKPSGAMFSGHRFDFGFTHNGKALLLQATASGTGTGTVGGTANADLKPKAVFDTANSQVVLTIDRASVEKAAGAPLPNGAVLTKTVAHSTALIATGGATVADTAQGTTPEQQSYTVGDNHCFAAASSPTSDSSTATIAISAPSRVRTSDLEVVNATLTDSEGKPLAGKRVTAVVGAGTAVAGTTNSAGQVRLSPRVVDRAGTRVLSVRYAGDASSKTETRKPLTVLAEVSKISTGSSGTGPTHTFTMTLTDDDAPRHPYAGAKLTVGYSGKTVTVTTDRSGRATLKLKPGTHIDVRYGGKSGFVLPATARTVVR